VKCDRVGIDVCNAERSRNLQRRCPLWQLPQAAEQPLRLATGEHDLAGAGLDPQRGAREDRQLALLLARGDDRQLVLPSSARRDTQLGDGTHEAARRLRRADRGAELHEALVELAGGVGLWQCVHQLAGARPQLALAGGGLDVVGHREHAR
jgi:hypothetical protein